MLLVMYIMQQKETFKYKANEIENFIAVYKRVYKYGVQCMINHGNV